MVISYDATGRTAIWPGSAKSASAPSKDYALYLVVSPTPLPISADSERLSQLPPGTKWGPVYLKTGR
jgi:hypothetical protein